MNNPPHPPGPRVFADHVAAYAQAGWPGVLPVPPLTKTPPPDGFTGAEGRDTDPVTLVQWATNPKLAAYSIALRMPADVIGIDVDQYRKGTVEKHGAETFGAYLERWGPLPATWTSTARDPGGPSRIYFYRVPPQRYATKLATETTGDVEIIQRHHRYAVVWPSPHKDVAGVYTWYDPAGAASDQPPKPTELPELPAAWVAGLAAGAASASATSADRASGEALLDQLRMDWRQECAEVTSARLQAVELLGKADQGSRHDTMTERTHHLVQLAAGGHAGVAAALMQLAELWATLTAGEDRAEELERALVTSARKAVTVVGAVQIPNDPCLMVSGYAVAAPAPYDARPDSDPEAAPPLRWWSPREVIGAHVFDPNADLDQTLAETVLERTWPAVRYAYDVGKWLRRGPEEWELLDDQSRWAVAQVAPLMPVGDPTAEKGSDQHARSSRRARLMTTAGAGGVAAKMRDLTVGGYHPCALRLDALDLDPDVLWAGGVPWDLRASRELPTQAAVDPTTPHLRSAMTSPEPVPTPLWDAFLAAVWPEESVRRWALRVLSVAVTGHSARILPILLGDGGRGKTQTVELIMRVLGSYAVRADTRLLKNPETAHASIVYALKDHRIAFIDEGPPEGRWAQERLKDLTGGGTQTANQMHQNPITFRPTHTLVLAANEEPILIDAAVRSRARLIPCDGDPDQVAAARAAIGNVHGPRWLAEAPGVLAQLMAEAAGWLAEPESASQLAAPEHIRYLAETISVEQDPVRVWLEEETETYEPGTSSRELYQAFRLSCQRSGIRGDLIPTEQKWGRALTRLGFPYVHTRSGKRRLLRLHGGGFLPGMTPSPAAFLSDNPAVAPVTQLAPRDPIVTQSEPYGSQVKPQVNRSESVTCDPVTQLSTPLRTHAPAHAHARQNPNQGVIGSHHPSASEPETAVDLREHGRDPSAPKGSRSMAATQKAAEKRAQARAEAVEAAGGPLVPLPAVVTRDAAVAGISVVEADALLATVLDELTVDVEHTGFPVGHRDYALRTVQLGTEAFAVDLDPHDADQADVVRRHVTRVPRLHAHSATADLVPLAHAGLVTDLEDAWARMHDTVIPAKLADPASTGPDPDLKRLAGHVLGEEAVSPRADKARAELFKAGRWLTKTLVTTPPERSGWAQVDPTCTTMITYAAGDVLDDAAIAKRLPAVPPGILERERLAQRMTARVAYHGLRIDGPHVLDLLAGRQGKRQAAREQITAVSAGAIENPGSNPQVGAVLEALGAPLPRTATGKPSVREAVLAPMGRIDGPVGELARLVLAYREHDTAIGLFLEPYAQLVEHGDGRARPTVYTLSADTGRMSCVRPNLQQVPREGGFRACITADPGQLLVSADFAGVELRVAAALSGDSNLRAILADADRDLHWEIARLAFGPAATKADRYAVKRGVFGRIYGGGVAAIAAGVGVSEAVAQAIIDALDTLLPELSEWSRMVRRAVEAGHTQFPTYAGRVVHLDRNYPHKAPNYCIQGTARELLVDALVRWSETPWGGAVLLPVHDELVVPVPEAEAVDATAALVACMTSELHGIPIVAEASDPSYAWKDAS